MMAANFPLFPKPDALLPSSFLFPTEEADGTRDNVSAEREREREKGEPFAGANNDATV